MIASIPCGALTALVTPFGEDLSINWDIFERLIEFQVSQGISGIVPVGTTGESPTLTEVEHYHIISRAVAERCGVFVLAGCGSNCTKEAMGYVERVARKGGRAVLLVDPYYNGPSSLEIRKEYYEPIAKAFPDIAIVPYIIPGRTGCNLLPMDLAILRGSCPNVCAVKDATGDFNNVEDIRTLTSPQFQIFSGDDDKTLHLMGNPLYSACGVISVVSNIAPAAVQKMCQAMLSGEGRVAYHLNRALQPLFDIVTISAERKTELGRVVDRFRNPLSIKTAMNVLGMNVGPCRRPLGKMSLWGLDKVRVALTTVNQQNPEIFSPIAEFFKVDIAERLANDSIWAKYMY